MKINQDQLLVIASDTSVHTISKGLEAFPGLKIIRANGDAEVVELLVTHQFIGIFMENDLPGISALKLAARLSNHGNSEITPLVFITNTSTPLDLFAPFPSLLLDFIPKPIDPGLLRAKIKLLLALHTTQKTVTQSIDELDHVHEQIMDLQRISLKGQALQKQTANFSSAVAGQIQSPLKNIQAGIYQLQKTKDSPPQTEKNVNHIRNAAQRIAGITQKMAARLNLSPKPLTHLTDDTGDEFGVLLPNTGPEGAQILARRILKAIRSHGLEINGTPFPLTVSIGIASHTNTAPYQEQSQNQDLVKQAIKAAALASQQGGNTIQHLTTSDLTHV